MIEQEEQKRQEGQEKELGRIQKSEDVEIVVRASEFRGEKGIDIREFVTSERYSGWSKRGLRIPAEKWPEFKRLIEQAEFEE